MLNVTEKISIEKIGLSNGATLLYKFMPSAPRLALSLYLPGGNLLDPSPGMSDLTDRLLMKGTKHRTQEQIAIEIDGMTLEMDVDTKRDYSAMYSTMLEEDLEPSLALMSDLFYNALPEQSAATEFEREKEKMLGEIMMEMDSPKNRASDQLISTVFKGTPYGITSSVVSEQIPKMTRVQAVQEHYAKAYQTQGMVVSVAGDIHEDIVKNLVEQYFPPRNTVGYPTNPVAVDQLNKLILPKNQYVTFARDDSSQAHIYKGWLAPNAKHPDYYPLVVMNTILGGAGLSSRLFIELRDKQGLAYNVRSSLESYQHKGLFLLYIGTEPSNKEKCLNGFIDECDKLKNTPVSAQELADAKRNILGRRSIYLETAPQICNYIGANFVMGRTLEDIERLAERIEAVTPDDIQRVAQTYLNDQHVISVVGPSQIL